MRASPVRSSFVCTALIMALASVGATQTPPAQVQTPRAAAMSRDEIVAFAKAHVAVARLRDSLLLQLGLPANRSDEAQKQVRESVRAKTDEVFHHSGMTADEFRRKTYVVSTDDVARAVFDTVVSQLTGVPLQSKLPPGATSIKMPAGAVGTHIGHLVNSFGDTPTRQGLLAAGLSEARTAIQHAELAARAPANLDAMKLHAGHVINAVDPSVVASGPGLGYGVKKAALGVATHIELAAKADSASPNVIAHAAHIAMSARNTVTRADQVVALAQRIQAATSAAEAAPLVSQLVSLTQQLVAGGDANGDGRTTWELGEGGLQQVQDHVSLLLAGERLPPG